MKALFEGLRALGPARLAAMGAVAVGVLGLLALLVARGGSSDQMALLYGDLDPREAAQVTEQLNRRHIRYKLAGGGTQILVPADQIPDTRLLLAREGLPSGGSIGYELFDRGDGLAFTESSRRSTKPARWKGRSPARSAPSAGCARRASTLCCPAANPSPATARIPRPASC